MSAEDKQLVDDFEKESIELLMHAIDTAHKHGQDLPDQLKDQLKTSHLGKQLELDNKMDRREKAKAKAKLKKE